MCYMISYYGNIKDFRTVPYINQSWQALLLVFYLCYNGILESTGCCIVDCSVREDTERDHAVEVFWYNQDLFNWLSAWYIDNTI